MQNQNQLGRRTKQVGCLTCVGNELAQGYVSSARGAACHSLLNAKEDPLKTLINTEALT